jgi:hypothetical protein
MARVYKLTDRITIKVDDITIKIAPLSLDQKNEIQNEFLLGRTKGSPKHLTNGTVLSLKYALKDIQGLEDADGKPYSLEFDSNALTDSCVQDLMNLDLAEKLAVICATMTKGVPQKFDLEGVEIVKTAKVGDDSKNA